MLSREHRLASRVDISRVVKRGRRAAGPLLVVHALAADSFRATVVTPRTVGSAPTRNRIKRRLRHALRRHMTAGVWCVVRVLPAAALATEPELSSSLEDLLSRVSKSA